MILDETTLFSDRQSVAANGPSTNVVDLGPVDIPAGRDIGKGKPIPILIQVVEGFDKLTSLAVAVQVSADEAFTSPKTVATTPAIPVASLVAGYQFVIDYVPRGTDERYMRLNYTIVGTAPDNGAITAGISMGHQTNG